MKELSSDELSRYERSLLVEGFNCQQQLMLKESSVLVIGAGGLGSAVLQYLVAAGVGCCGIAEYDVVSLSNLQRQVLYAESDLGHSKSEAAYKRLKLVNSNVDIVVHNMKVDVDNADELTSLYDVIIDCSDNYIVRYTVDNSCRKFNKPFIYGSIENMTGQISTFHYNGAKGYVDLFPYSAPAKDKIGVLSPIPGIIGSLQALEAIKIITRCGDTLSNKLLVMNLKTYSFSIFEI